MNLLMLKSCRSSIERHNAEMRIVMIADFRLVKFASLFPIAKSLMPETRYIAAIVARNNKARKKTIVMGLNQLIFFLTVCSCSFEAIAKPSHVDRPG
jgi:hypothetical protein